MLVTGPTRPLMRDPSRDTPALQPDGGTAKSYEEDMPSSVWQPQQPGGGERMRWLLTRHVHHCSTG